MSFDRAVYDQVVRLLGASTALDFLRMLRTQLQELGTVPEDAVPPPATLTRLHRIASEAGLLGFGELSRACKSYENAWTANQATVDAAQARRLNDLTRSHLGSLDALILSESSMPAVS